MKRKLWCGMLKAQGGDNNMTSRARARLIKEAAHKRNQIGLLCLLLHPPTCHVWTRPFTCGRRVTTPNLGTIHTHPSKSSELLLDTSSINTSEQYVPTVQIIVNYYQPATCDTGFLEQYKPNQSLKLC